MCPPPRYFNSSRCGQIATARFYLVQPVGSARGGVGSRVHPGSSPIRSRTPFQEDSYIMPPRANPMQFTLKLKTKVLPGHRIEIRAPQLTEGQIVEVSIAPETSSTELSISPRESADSWIRRYREWYATHKN